MSNVRHEIKFRFQAWGVLIPGHIEGYWTPFNIHNLFLLLYLNIFLDIVGLVNITNCYNLLFIVKITLYKHTINEYYVRKHQI